MARCPRCTATVPAYTRCQECGLVLGFEGISVLIEFEKSVQFHRVRRLAQRQASCSEWTEENGRRFLRVTYPLAELASFYELVAAGAQLSDKHVFLNGLEIRWSAAEDRQSSELPFAAAAPIKPFNRPTSISHQVRS